MNQLNLVAKVFADPTSTVLHSLEDLTGPICQFNDDFLANITVVVRDGQEVVCSHQRRCALLGAARLLWWTLSSLLECSFFPQLKHVTLDLYFHSWSRGVASTSIASHLDGCHIGVGVQSLLPVVYQSLLRRAALALALLLRNLPGSSHLE
jgi:hypothetical protein